MSSRSRAQRCYLPTMAFLWRTTTLWSCFQCSLVSATTFPSTWSTTWVFGPRRWPGSRATGTASPPVVLSLARPSHGHAFTPRRSTTRPDRTGRRPARRWRTPWTPCSSGRMASWTTASRRRTPKIPTLPQHGCCCCSCGSSCGGKYAATPRFVFVSLRQGGGDV